MTDAEKRDRVIKGLEFAINYLIQNESAVAERGVVMTNPKDEEKCINQMQDALALLKAQEARVVAYDEIDNHEVLYLEVRDVETEDGLAPWVKIASGRWFSPLLCSETCPDMILSMPNEYGRICRCWTSRPTDAQRKAIAWE